MVSLKEKSTLSLIIIASLSFMLIPPLYDSFINRNNHIILATTTSTENSGLLDFLHPKMTKDIDIIVEVVPVGTGAALEQAKKGLADLVLVHAISLEDQFIAEGFGIHRVTIMSNDFVIVGPSSDHAQIRGLDNNSAIFERLHNNGDFNFISRGDNSGTHIKEKELWSLAGIQINISDYNWYLNNSWYIEVGSGMSQTLLVASELQGYTLTDRGTWLFMRDTLNLELLAEGSELWKNFYSVILVNPAKFLNATIDFQNAKRYVQWLISTEGQSLIDSYKINGEKLFHAEFVNTIDDLSLEEILFWEIESNQNTTSINRTDCPSLFTLSLIRNRCERKFSSSFQISVIKRIKLNTQILGIIEQAVRACRIGLIFI